MIRIKQTFSKMQKAIAIALLTTTAGIAQVVTVPAGCTVKVAGTGGNIAANQVGNGGVVTMPDTFAGGTFTCTTPSGYTLTGWSLKGDLSVTTTSVPPAAPTQAAGAVSSVSIQSYNKNYRSSEIASEAKSKGVVTIGYNAGACTGYSMSFEVYKTFTTAPLIVGPACVEAGKPCTFSVDQVVSDNAGDKIGFDQYYWSGIPNGTVSYFSADNSSITFTPTTNATFTIKCSFGKANPWDGGEITTNQSVAGTTFVTKTVGASPVEPVYFSTGIIPSTTNPACVATGVTSFTINYPVVSDELKYYNWEMKNTGWTIGSQTTGSVTINTNGFNNPGTLSLTVTNGTCTPLTLNYQINRSLAAPVAITPVVTGNNCLPAGSASNMFAISTSAAANPVTWTVSPAGTGVTVVPGTTSSTVAVNVASTATVGAYTLIASSTSCAGNISYPFTVKPLVPTISGTACVAVGGLTPQTYTCAASTGATYAWTFPAGWSAPSFTTTTNSITVTPTSATAVLNGTVTVTANGITGCNNSAVYTIKYASTAPTGVAVGCFSVGVAGGASVTFANPLAGIYTATMVSTVAGSTNVITSPLTLSGNTLTFTTAALTAGTYNLNITHDSGCGTTATSTTPVTVAGNGAMIVPVFTTTSDTYIVAGAPANATYIWQVNGSTVVTSAPNVLILTGPSAPTSVVCLVSSGGCTTRVVAATGGTHNKKVESGDTTKVTIEPTIYPNPNNGSFTIKVGSVKQNATAVIYSMSGVLLDTFVLKAGENNINKDTLLRGTYIIALTIDGVITAQKIKIK